MEDQNEKHKKTFFLAAIILTVVVLVVLYIMFGGQKEQPIDEGGVMEETTEEVMEEGPQTGKIGLSVKGGNVNLSKGDEITLFVYADSYDAEVTAYDAVIHYDPNLLVQNEITTLLDGMDLYDTEEPLPNGNTELIVTGVKGLARQEPFFFSNTALMEITFTAIASGKADVTIAYEKESNRDSNLFDSTTQDILTQVEGVSLAIK